MKYLNYLKKISIIAPFVVTVLIITACSPKTVDYSEVISALFNIYVLNEPSTSNIIGVTNHEAELIIENLKENAKINAKKVFEESGLIISDDKIDKIYNTQLEGMKNISLSFEESYSTPKRKVIKVSTQTFDVVKASEKSGDQILEQFLSGNIPKSMLGDALADLIIGNLKMTNVSNQKTSFDTEFVLQTFNINGRATKVWAPIDLDKFGQKLILASKGQI